MGNKVLRQRLRGPTFAAYYPRRVATFKDLQKAYPDYETYDDEEEDRVEHVQMYVQGGNACWLWGGSGNCATAEEKEQCRRGCGCGRGGGTRGMALICGSQFEIEREGCTQEEENSRR